MNFCGVKKSTFYKWKKHLTKKNNGLIRKKPVAYNFPNKIEEDIIEKVFELRKEHKGVRRIKWYLGTLN